MREQEKDEAVCSSTKTILSLILNGTTSSAAPGWLSRHFSYCRSYSSSTEEESRPPQDFR
jgi:hypothetical protein